MTYAYSSVVAATLLAAHKVGGQAGPCACPCVSRSALRQTARPRPNKCQAGCCAGQPCILAPASIPTQTYLPPLPAPCPSPLPTVQAGKRFEVVVVDSRPLLEGRRMLTALLEGGITCEYCHLNGLSYQITEVDKVGGWVGGWVGGRAGRWAGGRVGWCAAVLCASTAFGRPCTYS